MGDPGADGLVYQDFVVLTKLTGANCVANAPAYKVTLSSMESHGKVPSPAKRQAHGRYVVG